MKTKGFFGIGCFNMKFEENYGTLFRTAYTFGASYIFLIGNRFKKQASDTCKSWKNIPLFEYETFEDFKKNTPYKANIIGVELTDEATKIKNFKHPLNAVYLLGAEDIGLSENIIKQCDKTVVLPGDWSLNVAVAGSIVLFDRINKLS
ncbi:MAG: RNA methyltransferase [Deltaproteobacteria bacterium]|nr:RNA methyltransferase [Deltaproteobacteria bacterium]